MISFDQERGTATFTGDDPFHEAIIAAVGAPDNEPRDFDEAQRMTFEQMHTLLREMVIKIDAFGGEPHFVHVNPRHRWIARWTTRTGKTLARKLWGAV